MIQRSPLTADRLFYIKDQLFVIHNDSILRPDGSKVGDFIYFRRPWPRRNQITHWPEVGWQVVYKNGKPENEILGKVTAVPGEIPEQATAGRFAFA